MSPAEIAAAILAAPGDARLTGHVWWCGDYHCDCTMAQIDQRRPDPRTRGWWLFDVVWAGEFHTDGESEPAYAELRRMAELIKAERPAAWRRVRWVFG